MPTRADESATADLRPVDPALARCVEQATHIAENLEACEVALDSNERLCVARVEKAEAEKWAETVRLKGSHERITVLKEALEASEARADREVWEHPGWWLAGGFAAGLVVATGVVYGSVWAVGQLRPAIPPADSTP